MEYINIAPNEEAVGNLYYETALKCVTENGTLQGIITIEPKSDNETKEDNKTIIKPKEKPQDLKEESLPDQPKKESNGLPDTLFQG